MLLLKLSFKSYFSEPCDRPTKGTGENLGQEKGCASRLLLQSCCQKRNLHKPQLWQTSVGGFIPPGPSSPEPFHAMWLCASLPWPSHRPQGAELQGPSSYHHHTGRPGGCSPTRPQSIRFCRGAGIPLPLPDAERHRRSPLPSLLLSLACRLQLCPQLFPQIQCSSWLLD